MSNVNNMSYMFANDTKLAGTLDCSVWGANSVTTLNSMFANDPALTTVNIPTNINAGNLAATGMDNMFVGDTGLTSGTFGTSTPVAWSIASGVLSLGSTTATQTLASNYADLTNFWPWSNSSALKGVKTVSILGTLNTSTVQQKNSLAYLLANLPAATKINGLSKLSNTANVTDMSYMFANDPVLTGNAGDVVNGSAVPSGTLNLSTWSSSSVFNMSYMFSNDAALQAIIFSPSMSGGNLTTMSNAFAGATGLVSVNFNGGFSGVPSTADMSSLFAGDSSLAVVSGTSNSTINTTASAAGAITNSSNSSTAASTIKTQNVNLYVGQTWNPSAAFVSAYDGPAGQSYGSWGSTNLTETDSMASNGYVNGSGTVLAAAVGKTATVTYTLKSTSGTTLATKTATVTFVAVPVLTLSASTATVNINGTVPTITAKTATGYDGTANSAVTKQVGSNVNTATAGTYTITWQLFATDGVTPLVDASGSNVTATVTVTVQAGPTGSLTLYSVPTILNFMGNLGSNLTSQLQTTQQSVGISDTRSQQSGWTLGVTASTFSQNKLTTAMTYGFNGVALGSGQSGVQINSMNSLPADGSTLVNLVSDSASNATASQNYSININSIGVSPNESTGLRSGNYTSTLTWNLSNMPTTIN
ncbi:beta strand repeat-containing protein [Weissella oryzae]|uniref:beta strand repeat-containing protein n=1 Tax=Weissella oryzae TaxID=1129792 RepID=UPI001680038D|nr:BspA family leucine-rich repeat surface protein [Weissella oryzae]